MKEICGIYLQLFDGFLSGSISVMEFQSMYLKLFKSEKRLLSNDLYEVLEGVFGDVDSFTTDSELLATKPGFYLNELMLRERVKKAFDRLLASIQ